MLKLKLRYKVVIIVMIIFLVFQYEFSKGHNDDVINVKYSRIADEKIDWNDYPQLYMDSQRKGFGEQGQLMELTDLNDISKNEELYRTFGMSVLKSDKISVNRSVPDFRDPLCLKKRYLKNLPKVSIIITFVNEIFSVFKRCLHSLYNRTPHQLIKEVILVNDCSTLEYLYGELEEYIAEHFSDLNIKILNLKNRHGSAKTRKAGVEAATAEIIFMMESHIELAYNWLPPLLEPLIGHPKRVTLPVIDFIDPQLHYYANKPSRAVFDWKMNYNLIPRFATSKDKELEPFENPLMNGGVFAMHREYFFEIGPNDEGLVVYGAEQIDMSLRIWLCGGEILEVPCSRIGHGFRSFNKFRAFGNISDYIGYSQKRVFEVWFDDYKKYVEMRDSERYSKLDVGDLSKNIEFKKAHNCKPFEYYLKVVAPDLEENFPTIVPTFASGIVRLLNTSQCWDTYDFQHGNGLHLYTCDNHPTYPRNTQNFQMTFYRDIENVSSQKCLDAYALQITGCHHGFGNQYFKYDQKEKQILLGNNNQCIEANTVNNSLILKKCNKKNLMQKWEWGFVNLTALANYESVARKLN